MDSDLSITPGTVVRAKRVLRPDRCDVPLHIPRGQMGQVVQTMNAVLLVVWWHTGHACLVHEADLSRARVKAL